MRMADLAVRIRCLRPQQKYLSLVVFSIFAYAAALIMSNAVRTHQSSIITSNWSGFIPFALWLATFISLDIIIHHNLPENSAPILPLVAFLSGIGIMTIWRLQPYLGFRQGYLLLLSIPVCLFLTSRHVQVETLLTRYYAGLLLGGLFLTGLTIFLGVYPSGVGPQLWLRIGGVIFQPSEILKPISIIFLAGYFSSQQASGTLSTRKLIVLSILYVASAGAFFIIQKDLGTAAILIMIFTFMLYQYVGRRRIFIIAILAAVIALCLGDNFIPLVHVRINTWLNPWPNSVDTSYQVVQSLIALAEGGVWGTGPGLGSPSIIPLAHSDFIFSAIAEEMGWVGTFLVMSAAFLITYLGLERAKKQQYEFNRFAIAGIACYVGIQTILIAGGNIKLLPLTGVTLPLVSAGGSSLLTTMFSFLLMLRLDSQKPAKFPNERSERKINVFLFTQILFFIALSSILLYEINWAVFRSTELTLRADNLRPLIADRYSARGNILDRHGEIIVYTNGEPGSFSRSSTEPSTGHLMGYSDLLFGQTGIEYYQNDHLRGNQSQTGTARWINDIFYNQPLGNNDLQTTIDIGLQRYIDQLLSGRTGAAIVMNPETGEIQAMYSTPEIDTNRLTEQMVAWKGDPSAPLLNRATMGQYVPGTALTPILLVELFEKELELPTLPESYLLFFDNIRWECADTGVIAYRWPDALRAGCPSPLLAISQSTPGLIPQTVFEKFGLAQALPVEIEQAETKQLPQEFSSQNDNIWQKIILGIPDFQVTPLQMAAALSRLYQMDTYSPQPTYSL